jgi:hypothetical protein
MALAHERDRLGSPLKRIEFLNDPTTGKVRIGCSPLLLACMVSAARFVVEPQQTAMPGSMNGYRRR